MYVVNLQALLIMRRTKEDAEKTRSKILKAAVALFAEKGFAQTSLEQIAAAAEVTRGAIYWHFKNKAEIFDALQEQLYQPVTEMILQDLQTDHPEPLMQLQDTCIQLLLDIEADQAKRHGLKLFLATWNYAEELLDHLEKHRAKKDESLNLFSQYFERAQEKGFIHSQADPKTLTLSLRCYMKGIISEHLDDPDNFSMQQQAPTLIHLFFSQWLNSH